MDPELEAAMAHLQLVDRILFGGDLVLRRTRHRADFWRVALAGPNDRGLASRWKRWAVVNGYKKLDLAVKEISTAGMPIEEAAVLAAFLLRRGLAL